MIGIDLEEIARFKPLLSPRKMHLLKRFFTAREIAYAQQYRDAASHLAGAFAAKEAASKALGVRGSHYLTLEVRHALNGAPQIWKKGKKLRVAISISHTAALATAVAYKI